MKRGFKSIIGISLLALSTVFTACKGDKNSPGMEYMPDMYRSSAIEPYVDYGHVKGRDIDSLTTLQSALTPPYGTVPYYGDECKSVMMPYKHKAPTGAEKTHALWGDDQSDLGRDAAKFDVNPIAYSKDALDTGKDLYTKFCTQCHGEAGDGQGKIVQNGKLSGVPNYADKNITEGEIFYTITYGKGVMGQHKSLLNKKERWLITMYVKALQNGGKYEVTETTDSTTNVAVADTVQIANTAE